MLAPSRVIFTLAAPSTTNVRECVRCSGTGNPIRMSFITLSRSPDLPIAYMGRQSNIGMFRPDTASPEGPVMPRPVMPRPEKFAATSRRSGSSF